MNLGELIETLEAFPPETPAVWGFANPHAYRGYHNCLGLEQGGASTTGEMLDVARSCVGATFEGWRGGEYTYGLHTDVYYANEGMCFESDTPITPAQLFSAITGTNYRWVK